jgi:hypothetical protein
MPIDYCKLTQTILRSSKRVAKAKKMIGLKKGEYIISYGVDITVGNHKTDKKRILKTIKGQPAGYFLVEKVIPYIVKEIFEYFDVYLNPIGHILNDNFLYPGYSLHYSYGGVSDYLGLLDIRDPTMAIIFRAKLNSQQLENLLKQIQQFNKGIKKDISCFRFKPIELFDEKFWIFKEYQMLRKKYPKKISHTDLDNLREEAKKLLGIKTDFTKDDLRKVISDFKKSFYG